ncbi:hypothetical protein JCM8547_006481 [Rhodosporidiobolus lusitaniae]
MSSLAAAPAAPAASAPTPQEREANRIRFETELEFVQCLANPFYLQSLAQQNLLTSEPFLNYLSYLLYFTSPRFSRFLQYPQSLHHLRLLTFPGPAGESFRKALKEQPLLAQELGGQQVAHWAGWREREGAPGEVVEKQREEGEGEGKGEVEGGKA